MIQKITLSKKPETITQSNFIEDVCSPFYKEFISYTKLKDCYIIANMTKNTQFVKNKYA